MHKVSKKLGNFFMEILFDKQSQDKLLRNHHKIVLQIYLVSFLIDVSLQDLWTLYHINYNLRVVVGEHDVTKNDGQERIAVVSWESHPNYNPSTLNYDFAIITIGSSLSRSEKISPICLPNPTKVHKILKLIFWNIFASLQSFDNKDAVVTGWGSIYSGGFTSSILREVNFT